VIGGGLGRLERSGESEYGTTNDSLLSPALSTYLHATLPGYFHPSKFTSGTIQSEWTGILAATSDGRPFVGEVPGMDGVWVCAGFNGHGMVLCLKSAEALVERISGGVWPEWWPGSFGVEGRLKGEFGGKRDMQVSSEKGES
jgi:glycine/D-amino acid oxidase-like deaminating enzyme